MVNIGGGIPISYGNGIPSLDEISGVIKDSVKKYFNEKPYIYVEPGRFLVGESGVAVTKVTQLEEGDNIDRATVDLSVFSGLIEIIENKEYFSFPISSDSLGEKRKYQIGGSTCAGTDIISKEVVLPKLSVDFSDPTKSSRIFINKVGAYTLDYIGLNQSNGFNGAPIPKVYYVKGGKLV